MRNCYDVKYKERGYRPPHANQRTGSRFFAVHRRMRSRSEGMKQADIFRACGLDWEDQPNATSSQQPFWLVALPRVLEKKV